MSNGFDDGIDWLVDAALTVDQRRTWNRVRGELAALQEKNRELAEKIRLLEAQPHETEPTILGRPDFNREVARMLAHDERYNGMSSVLYFNFDRLEDMAARYGRSVCNAAIREIGLTLMRSVRGSDIVGRLAPDEFGILLTRCDNPSAWRKAERLTIGLQQSLVEIHGCKLDIRVSYGAYTFRDKENVAVGLKEAAQAMTRAAR